MKSFVVSVDDGEQVKVSGMVWDISGYNTLRIFNEKSERVAEFVNWRYIKNA